MMTCDFITATVHDDALLKTIDHMRAQLHGSRAHSKLSLNVMTQAKMEQRRSVTRTYYFRSKAFPTSAQRWMFWTNNGCWLPVGHNPPSVCPTWENKTPHPSIFAQAVDCHACTYRVMDIWNSLLKWRTGYSIRGGRFGLYTSLNMRECVESVWRQRQSI